MSSSAFFKPAGAWVGDLIPVERDGELWLYYLLELRESPKPGTPWALVRTRDLVSFEDCGVALPHGAADAYDFNAYTGSVVRAADGSISAAEVADQVGISRPTAQRYLAYLVEHGVISLHLKYGATGRPEHRYSVGAP